jgi:hypothetical protein
MIGKFLNRGYIVECDLEYPKHLHNTHKAIPLAAEKLKVSIEDLSEYDEQILGSNVMLKSEKLVNAT